MQCGPATEWRAVPAGQVELHVQDGPLDTYRDDAIH